MIKRLLNCKFHIRPLFDLFINKRIENFGEYWGLNNNKREVPIIVSLTSYEERFESLTKTLYSLLNQNRKPDRLVLWLSNELNFTQLPYEITQFVKNGLEIKFVKDIGSYTKGIYTFRDFPENIIVTADDDVYYTKDWLDKLYMSYAAHPEDIHCHRVHRIRLQNGNIAPYEQWEHHINEESARFDNFLTGVGGVLYPPMCFSSEVLREDIFLKSAPNADDIWFWVMAITHNRKIRLVKNHNKNIITSDIWQHILKKNLYSLNRNGKNDEQLNNLMKYYEQNILNKLLVNKNDIKSK